MNIAINQRVKEYFKTTGLKQIDFAKAISTSGDRVSKWFRDEEKITGDYVIEVVSKFPDLNARWLLTGEGDMLTDSAERENPKLSVYKGSNLYRVFEDINKQATEPVIDYNVIDPEKAVRQLLAAVAYKDFELQKLSDKYNDLNDKYVSTLEVMTGKKKVV